MEMKMQFSYWYDIINIKICRNILKKSENLEFTRKCKHIRKSEDGLEKI
jgi:hypothetical protein